MNAQDTSAEPKPDLPLEIAHLLLIDVVGYSKLLVNEQIELLQDLNQIVRNTECFRAAETKGKLIRGVDRRRDGAPFLPQSGRAGAMCARDQQSVARASAYPAADGSAQRPSEPSHRC